MDTQSTPKLLTVNEVADALGCGRTLVYDLLSRRELSHIKIGRLTRISLSEVERFLQERIVPEHVDGFQWARPQRGSRSFLPPAFGGSRDR